MPFRGRPNKNGRPKGSKNKSTAHAQEAVAKFVEDNAPLFQQWLTEIHTKSGPAAAFDRVVALLEFHIPKLARVETTGKDGGPIQEDKTLRIILERTPNP